MSRDRDIGKMTGLNEHRETFVHFLMARNEFYRKQILEAYSSDKGNQEVYSAHNHFQEKLKCFQEKFLFDRYYCIYYNSLVGKALNLNLLGPLKIPLPLFPHNNLSLGDYDYDYDVTKRNEKNRDILPIIESSNNVVNKLRQDKVSEDIEDFGKNWEKWRDFEIFLHQKFKPDFNDSPEIGETDLFTKINKLSNKDKGWFKGDDKKFDLDLITVDCENGLYTSFYGKYLIAPHLTNNHYGAFIIVYVKEHYCKKENEKVVMLLDGIAGMYWIHLADQIDDDLKKYHEQTSALRLSDAEYRAVKDDVIELTQRLDEANAISARIRSQIDPTWQNLGAVAEVFRLYLDENAKKIEYNEKDGNLRQVKADRPDENDWIVLDKETDHAGHPIDISEINETKTPAHLIKTVFKKDSICSQEKYKDLKEYILGCSAFSAKERQKAFKSLLGRRTGEIQVVQLMWGLLIALKEIKIAPHIYYDNSISPLLEKMKSCPTLMLDKKCPLAKNTHNMSFLNVIHELIVFILKKDEQQKKVVDLQSVLVHLDLKPKKGSILVIFFCEAVFGDRPEQLFIIRPRDEREKHDTGRVVNRLCEATTFQIKYEPSPLIRNHNDEEVKNWIGKESNPMNDPFTRDYFDKKSSGCFLKAMSPGCVISTGEATTVIALKLDIE